MVIRNRNGGCILRLFNDDVTIYNKTITPDAETGEDIVSWKRTVVHGVQWSDQYDKETNAGRLNVSRYAMITFPKGTFEGLDINPANEEDAIVCGIVTDTVSDTKGHRISDLLKKYQKAGLIKATNDNTGRTYLPNLKVVIS